MTAPALVMVGMGSSDAQVAQVTHSLRHGLQTMRPGLSVRCAFLEHCSPSVGQVVAQLVKQGVNEIVLVPLQVTHAIDPDDRVVGLAGKLGLGLMPGVAMSVSGLTGLDDRLIEGGSIGRPDAADALTATHRGLNWACIALGLVIGAAGFLLGSTPDGWAMGLAAALAVVVLLRTRVLPLAPQRLACFAAATAITAGLAVGGFSLAPLWTLAALAVLAVVLIGAVGLRLSGQLRARLSRLGNTLEFLAVLAGVPVLLGLLGVYADLLGAF